MAASAPATQQQGSLLQQQAIAQARLAFSKFPKGDAVFQACVQQQESLVEVVKKVLQETKIHKKKKSSLLLDKFQKYTLWLQNIGEVVDIAVQTQAGIACPIWAPVKFILKVSHDHSQAVERVFNLIETISVCLPRFEIYERLQTDDALQAALLNVFTDIVEYSACAFRFLKRSTLARLSRSVGLSYDQELKDIVARLERHSRAVDHTAVATELLKASQYRTLDALNHGREMKLKCEKWLSPANIKEIHERQVRARSSRTCTWISNDERYKRWEDLGSMAISDRFLCISGINGCGKSVLSSFIVERLERQQCSILHFSFSSTGTSQRTAADMTRTLVWQLLHKSVDEKSVGIVHDLMSLGQLVASDLWDALGNILGLSLAPVFCILDGIDECDDFDGIVIERVFRILHTHSKLHLILLGRPPAIQNLSLISTFTVSTIEITATIVSQDIEAYIEDEMARSQLLNGPELRSEISHILHEKSDGMFLWVRLTIDDLRKAATKSELVERLHKLPRGLEDVYRSILSHLTQNSDNFELQLAQNILGFTTVCCHPLTYDQLRYVHALDLRSKYCSSTPRSLDEFLIVQPIQRIINLCGGLIFEANGVVRLIHSSVKDFLARPADQWSNRADSELSGFHVDEKAFHGSFSHSCLDYMNTTWDTELLREPGGLQTVHLRYPFLKYAALHGVYHLNRVGLLSSSLLGKVETLLKATKGDFWVMYSVSLLLDNASLEMLGLMLDEYMSLDVWIGCHIELNLMTAFYKRVGHEVVTRTRNLGPSNYLSAQWQRVFEFARDFMDTDVHIHIEDDHAIQTNETEFQATSLLEPSLPHLSSSHLSTSHIVCLVNSCLVKPSSRRIEITLGLSSLLKHTRKLTDPLERLLQLLLAKASDLPLIVVQSIALFYQRFSKFETAIQFFNAALSKIDGQNTAIEFRLHDDIGYCYQQLRVYEKALHHYELALTGMESLFGKHHVRAFESLAAKCECLYLLSRYEDSLECSLSLVVRSRAIYGDNHEETLMARCWEGASLCALQRYDEALACSQTLSEMKNHVLNMAMLHWKGQSLHALGRYEEALRYFQEALAAYTAHSGEGAYNTLLSLHWTGRSLYSLGRYNDALADLQKLLNTNRVNVRRNDEDTLDSMFLVGKSLFQLGRYEEALATFQELLAAEKEVYGEWDKTTLHSLLMAGICHYGLYQDKEALTNFQEFRAKGEGIHKPEHEDVRISNFYTGLCLYNLRNYSEALTYFQEAFSAEKAIVEANHAMLLDSENWILNCLYYLHRYDDALILAEKNDNLTTSMAGKCLFKLRRYEEALLWFQNFQKVQKERYGEEDENTVSALHWVGSCLYELHRYEEALPWFQKMLYAQRTCLGNEHDETISAAYEVGQCFYSLHRYEEGLEYIGVHSVRPGACNLFLMAKCHLALSQYSKALECLWRICIDTDKHAQDELFLMAACYKGLSQYEKASMYHELAKNIAELDVLD